jgi:hypothetical protein
VDDVLCQPREKDDQEGEMKGQEFNKEKDLDDPKQAFEIGRVQRSPPKIRYQRPWQSRPLANHRRQLKKEIAGAQGKSQRLSEVSVEGFFHIHPQPFNRG